MTTPVPSPRATTPGALTRRNIQRVVPAIPVEVEHARKRFTSHRTSCPNHHCGKFLYLAFGNAGRDVTTLGGCIHFREVIGNADSVQVVYGGIL